MGPPLVQHFPDQSELSSSINLWLKLQLLRNVFATSSCIEQLLHTCLHQVQLEFHLVLLRLDIFSFRRFADRLQPLLELMSLVLELILNTVQRSCDVRTVVTGYYIDAGVVRESIASSRPTRFTPDVVRLAEAAFGSFGIVISQCLYPRNLLE